MNLPVNMAKRQLSINDWRLSKIEDRLHTLAIEKREIQKINKVLSPQLNHAPKPKLMNTNDRFQKNYLAGVTEYFDLIKALSTSTGKDANNLKRRIEQRIKLNKGLDELIRPHTHLILKAKRA